nr:phage tail protein [Clostridium scatologenes]
MGLCDGGVLNINSNTAAFGTVGTYYGGNGTIIFGKPDLRGAVPNPQLSYYLQLQGTYPVHQ